MRLSNSDNDDLSVGVPPRHPRSSNLLQGFRLPVHLQHLDHLLVHVRLLEQIRVDIGGKPETKGKLFGGDRKSAGSTKDPEITQDTNG